MLNLVRQGRNDDKNFSRIISQILIDVPENIKISPTRLSDAEYPPKMKDDESIDIIFVSEILELDQQIFQFKESNSFVYC